MIPQPSREVGLLLASLVCHADEALSPGGDPADVIVFRTLLKTPSVQEYLQALDELALIPLRRS